MKFDHIWHLVWLYNRMLTTDPEAKSSIDYMTKTRAILKEQIDALPVPMMLEEADNGMLTFKYAGNQP